MEKHRAIKKYKVKKRKGVRDHNLNGSEGAQYRKASRHENEKGVICRKGLTETSWTGDAIKAAILMEVTKESSGTGERMSWSKEYSDWEQGRKESRKYTRLVRKDTTHGSVFSKRNQQEKTEGGFQ